MAPRSLWMILGALAWIGCHKAPPPGTPAPPVAPRTPPPAPAPAPAPQVAQQSDDYARIKAMDVDAINRMGLLAEIHFDFDKADLHEGDLRILAKNAENLKRFDFLTVAVDGHCDERGTVEYNLALGERRAKAAFDYLISLGVPRQRLKSVSYGKEAPLCQEHDEGCWARNRRAHFTVTGKTSSPR
jgi:peptidoglycan-associated lipoprotein